jgi:hypothetical protein
VLKEFLYVGNDTHFIVDLANGVEVTVREQNLGSVSSVAFQQGERVAVRWPTDGALILLN